MDSASATSFTNDDWIAGLKAGRGEMVAALRARIRKGLGAALGGRSDVYDDDLDDYTQDAVMRILERMDAFRGDSSFTTWAMAVAVRVSLTALRRRRWAAKPIDDYLHVLASSDLSGGPANASGLRAELFAVLRAAIEDQLTPHQRQVLLGELDGVPQVVLADRLSATPGAIYKVSHDARKRLKDALARAGFNTDAVMEVLAS